MLRSSKHSLVFDLGLLSQSSETLDVCFGNNCGGGGKLISSTGNLLVSSVAFPNTSGNSLDAVLAAKWRDVSSMLTNFKLLDDLS